MVFSELFLAHGVCQCAFGNSLEQPIVREGERAIGQTLGLRLNVDVRNSDSVEDARILVGEEARSSPATVTVCGCGRGATVSSGAV
jgi:hypothetical protein